MTSNPKAILHGAPIIAICVAVPLAAQTVSINGGTLLSDPLATVSGSVTTGGVTSTGTNPSAQVVDLGTGEAAQVSSTATPASITNGGTFSIAADASGTGTAAAKVGNLAADVPETGTYQSALSQEHLLGDVDGATWNASATLLNTGTLNVRANAASADGDATATVTGDVAQTASG